MRTMTVDECVLYSAVETMIMVAFIYLYRFFMKTEPSIEVALVAEIYIYVLSVNIIFSFQKSTRITQRLELALVIAIALTIVSIAIESGIVNMAKEGFENADKEAFGILGTFANFLYETFFENVEKFLDYAVTFKTFFNKFLFIAILEAATMLGGYILNVIPIYNEREDFKLQKIILKKRW